MSKESTPTTDDVTVLSAEESASIAALDAFYPGITSTDPAAVIDRMKARFRGAQNLDDLFDALDGNNSKSMKGKTFEFRNVTWQPYKASRGIIPLAVCDAVNVATGEVEEFITTGEMVVEFLRQAQLLNLYPFKARIEGKVTRSGQEALNLVRA